MSEGVGSDTGESVEEIVMHVLRLAHTAVDGCELASCTLDQLQSAFPRSRLSVVVDLNSAEADLDGGPCRTAIDEGKAISVGDMGERTRWPRYEEVAVALGVRSVLAVPLSSVRGVLCLYSHRSHAFTSADESQGVLLASIVDLVIETGGARARAEDHLANLSAALASREVIGQAQGILMERGHMTAAAAFGHLRLASQRLNLKLTEVAQAVVETGADPLDTVES